MSVLQVGALFQNYGIFTRPTTVKKATIKCHGLSYKTKNKENVKTMSSTYKLLYARLIKML